jgi:hypothetical protein
MRWNWQSRNWPDRTKICWRIASSKPLWSGGPTMLTLSAPSHQAANGNSARFLWFRARHTPIRLPRPTCQRRRAQPRPHG